MEPIVLSGKRELDIYVNPQRQNLLRCMKLAGVPMTPKQIAGRMGISPSSVQHHIGKLMELGIVELSHTERIHGITASYYRALPRTVSIGVLAEADYKEERLALLQAGLSRVFTGYTAYCEKNSSATLSGRQYGDMLSGIIRLKPEEAGELYAMIRSFLDEHGQGGGDDEAWEYALIAYPVEEG